MSDTPAPPRCFRFGLRTLFVMMTVVALIAFSVALSRHRQQLEVIAGRHQPIVDDLERTETNLWAPAIMAWRMYHEDMA